MPVFGPTTLDAYHPARMCASRQRPRSSNASSPSRSSVVVGRVGTALMTCERKVEGGTHAAGMVNAKRTIGSHGRGISIGSIGKRLGSKPCVSETVQSFGIGEGGALSPSHETPRDLLSISRCWRYALALKRSSSSKLSIRASAPSSSSASLTAARRPPQSARPQYQRVLIQVGERRSAACAFRVDIPDGRITYCSM